MLHMHSITNSWKRPLSLSQLCHLPEYARIQSCHMTYLQNLYKWRHCCTLTAQFDHTDHCSSFNLRWKTQLCFHYNHVYGCTNALGVFDSLLTQLAPCLPQPLSSSGSSSWTSIQTSTTIWYLFWQSWNRKVSSLIRLHLCPSPAVDHVTALVGIYQTCHFYVTAQWQVCLAVTPVTTDGMLAANDVALRIWVTLILNLFPGTPQLLARRCTVYDQWH